MDRLCNNLHSCSNRYFSHIPKPCFKVFAYVFVFGDSHTTVIGNINDLFNSYNFQFRLNWTSLPAHISTDINFVGRSTCSLKWCDLNLASASFYSLKKTKKNPWSLHIYLHWLLGSSLKLSVRTPRYLSNFLPTLQLSIQYLPTWSCNRALSADTFSLLLDRKGTNRGLQRLHQQFCCDKSYLREASSAHLPEDRLTV